MTQIQITIYYNQVDVSKVQIPINNELDKYFKNYTIQDIIKHFEDWHSGNFQKEVLNQEDIQSLIVQTVLSHYIPNPIMQIFPKADIWNEATKQFQCVVINDENNLSKVWQAVEFQICNFFSDQNFKLLNRNEHVPDLSNKINKIKQHPRYHFHPIRKDLKSDSVKDLYMLLWHLCEVPLILDINTNDSSFENIRIALSKMLHKTKKRYVIFDKASNTDLRYFNSFNFLDIPWKITQEILKSARVCIQGKKLVTLEELELSDTTLEKITADLLIELWDPNSENIKVDETYVSRRVQVPTVSFDVFTIMNNDPNVVFLIIADDSSYINCIKNVIRFGKVFPWHMYKYFSKKFSSNVSFKSTIQPQSYSIILKKDMGSLKDYASIKSVISEVRKCEDQIIHCLRFVDNTKLEWIDSNKDFDQIKPFLFSRGETVTLPDKDLFHYLTFNIISGNAGEGKTTLLQFLADNCPSNSWMVNINMGDIYEYIDRDDFTAIKEFLSSQNNRRINSYNEFSKELFKNLCDDSKILVIIDGIDEIEINSRTENFLHRIKDLGIKTIIATRPSLRVYLEEKLETFSLFLRPLTGDDRDLLIKLTLRNNYVEYKETHLKDILLKVTLWDNIMGVPLLLKLFASLINAGNKADFDKFDITDLFEEYVKQQLKKSSSYNKFSCRTISRLALLIFYKDTTELFDIEDYLEDIEDKEEVFIKSKLIEKINKNNIPVFTHKSLAEFLVGKYFADRHDRIPHNFLKSLFYKELETVRLFFDIIVLKNCPLQSLVNGNNDAGFDYDVSDKFGRHGLHIGVSYGNLCDLRTTESLWPGVRIYESYNVINFPYFKPSKTFERRVTVPLDRFEEILKKGLDLYKKDDLFKMNVFEFAIESGSLEMMEVLSREYFFNKLENVNHHVLLYYAILNGYSNIFRQLKAINYKLKILPHEDNLLYVALIGENLDIINELLNSATDIHESNNLREMPLISWLSSFQNFYRISGTSILLMRPELALNEVQSNIIRLLVNKKVNIKATNRFGETPLHIICRSRRKSLTELLIENGAEVNRKTKFGDLPLHFAAQHSLENVKLLLKYKSEMDVSNFVGFSPLSMAVQSNSLDIVKFLITKGSHVNKSKKQIGPLIVAVLNGNVDCVNLLIEKGARINNSVTNNTLHAAISSGNLNCIKLLIKNGANVQKDLLSVEIFNCSKDIIEYFVSEKHYTCDYKNEKSPLFMAIARDDISLVETFISYGADVNARRGDGTTPLHDAAIYGLENSMQCLIKNGAKVDLEDKSGSTPIIAAAIAGQLNSLKCLINSGSDLQKYGPLAMCIATRNHHSALVDYLISFGLDINAFHSDGCAPVHIAASTHLDCLKNVVRKGADINLKSVKEGCTPLMLAAQQGLKDVLQYLIENGCQVDEEDVEKKTALTLASLEGYLECVKFLIEKGTDLSKYGPTAVATSTFNGHFAIADQLISSGVDINGLITDGDTAPIHQAIFLGNIQMLQYLVNKGANINLTTVKNSHTPLMLALSKNNNEIIRYLTENGALLHGEC